LLGNINNFLRLFDTSFQKNVKSHVFLKYEKNVKYVFSNTVTASEESWRRWLGKHGAEHRAISIFSLVRLHCVLYQNKFSVGAMIHVKHNTYLHGTRRPNSNSTVTYKPHKSKVPIQNEATCCVYC